MVGGLHGHSFVSRFLDVSQLRTARGCSRDHRGFITCKCCVKPRPWHSREHQQMSRAKKEGPHWESEARQEMEVTSRGQHMPPQWNGMPQRPNSGLAALGMESFCVLTYHLPRVALVSVLLFPESTYPQENVTSSSRSCPTSVTPVLHSVGHHPPYMLLFSYLSDYNLHQGNCSYLQETVQIYLWTGITQLFSPRKRTSFSEILVIYFLLHVQPP